MRSCWHHGSKPASARRGSAGRDASVTDARAAVTRALLALEGDDTRSGTWNVGLVDRVRGQRLCRRVVLGDEIDLAAFDSAAEQPVLEVDSASTASSGTD